MKLTIYPETLGDGDVNIIHNHFDCPSCGRKEVSADVYGDLNSNKGDCTIKCENCGTSFHTTAEFPYDPNAEWKIVIIGKTNE